MFVRMTSTLSKEIFEHDIFYFYLNAVSYIIRVSQYKSDVVWWLCVAFVLFKNLTRLNKDRIKERSVRLDQSDAAWDSLIVTDDCSFFIFKLYISVYQPVTTRNRHLWHSVVSRGIFQRAEDLFYQWLKSKNISSGNFLPKKKKLPRNRRSPNPVSPAPAWHATRLLTFHNVVWSLRRCQRRGSASRQTL